MRKMVIQDFNALIDSDKELNAMVEQISNPYKLLRFLKTYADTLHGVQIKLRNDQTKSRGHLGYEETNAIMQASLQSYLEG